MKLVPDAAYPHLRAKRLHEFPAHRIVAVMIHFGHVHGAADIGNVVLYETLGAVRVFEPCREVSGGVEAERTVAEHHAQRHRIFALDKFPGLLAGLK